VTFPEWTLTDKDPPDQNGLYLACECPPGGATTVFIGYWQEQFQRWLGSPFDEVPIPGSKVYWMSLPDLPEADLV
jgi:hypothetical protein